MCNINGRKISTLYPAIFKILCLILDDKAVCEGYEFTDETTSEDKLPQRKHMPQSPILPGKGCMKVIDSYNQQLSGCLLFSFCFINKIKLGL